MLHLSRTARPTPKPSTVIRIPRCWLKTEKGAHRIHTLLWAGYRLRLEETR